MPARPQDSPGRQLDFDRRLWWLTLGVGVPGSGLGLILLWAGDYSTQTRWGMTALVAVGTWVLAYTARERVIRPLQTIANLLSSLREGDYSFRARGAQARGTLGEVLREINALSATLQAQRLGALEAGALLRTVMGEIDVAVFAFDAEQRLRLVNRAGERLLAQPAERLHGGHAAAVGLADCLEGEAPRTVQIGFPGASGRWVIRRSQFREGGVPHQLLVLSDLSRELRAEERLAWQRLVRVLGHELNNSLTPIKSIAGSLEGIVKREPPPPDWQEDMRSGLGVIASRAEALTRFIGAYSRLAKLPPPRLRTVELGALVRRVASLETRVPAELEGEAEVRVRADADQLEQLLINLLRNAADAALEGAAAEGGAGVAPPSPGAPAVGTAPRVRIVWGRARAGAQVDVLDNGPGLANTANLFVPFFTTKPKGSGIGLVLCRQIAEAHDGSLTLENRADGPGCLARLRLPLG